MTRPVRPSRPPGWRGFPSWSTPPAPPAWTSSWKPYLRATSRPWSATLVTRIVREALTNAAKHASGSRVRVSLGTARDLLHVTVANTLTRSGVDPGHPALTGREREVLAALGCGLSNAELASALGITEATAKTHGSQVLAKLGHTARVQVAITAKEVGLAPAPRG